jgi:hypothetical protein
MLILPEVMHIIITIIINNTNKFLSLITYSKAHARKTLMYLVNCHVIGALCLS